MFRHLILVVLTLGFSFSSLAQLPLYTYENGRISKSIHDVYNQDGLLSVRIEYTYTPAGVVEYRILSSFDDKGHLVRREQYTVSDFLLVEETFKYDRHGNLTRREVIYKEETGEVDKSVEIRKYTYSRSGEILHRIYSLDGKVYFDE